MPNKSRQFSSSDACKHFFRVCYNFGVCRVAGWCDPSLVVPGLKIQVDEWKHSLQDLQFSRLTLWNRKKIPLQAFVLMFESVNRFYCFMFHWPQQSQGTCAGMNAHVGRINCRFVCGNKATARGFEPLRAEPNGFRVHHLNHSVTLSCRHCAKLQLMQSIEFGARVQETKGPKFGLLDFWRREIFSAWNAHNKAQEKLLPSFGPFFVAKIQPEIIIIPNLIVFQPSIERPFILIVFRFCKCFEFFNCFVDVPKISSWLYPHAGGKPFANDSFSSQWLWRHI